MEMGKVNPKKIHATGKVEQGVGTKFWGVGKGSKELKNSPTVDPKERTTAPVKQKRVRVVDINGSVLSCYFARYPASTYIW